MRIEYYDYSQIPEHTLTRTVFSQFAIYLKFMHVEHIQKISVVVHYFVKYGGMVKKFSVVVHYFVNYGILCNMCLCDILTYYNFYSTYLL
jgi:hypothetical protein